MAEKSNKEFTPKLWEAPPISLSMRKMKRDRPGCCSSEGESAARRLLTGFEYSGWLERVAVAMEAKEDD